jgi:hypothetical protein
LAVSGAERSWGYGANLGEADLHLLLDVALQRRVDWIVVDHYGADGAYLEGISVAGYRLAVLDDTGDRDLRAARLVVNPSLLMLAKYSATARSRGRMEAGGRGGPPLHNHLRVTVIFSTDTWSAR